MKNSPYLDRPIRTWKEARADLKRARLVVIDPMARRVAELDEAPQRGAEG